MPDTSEAQREDARRSLVEMKAEAYDLAFQIQALQQKLAMLNQQILETKA